MWGSEKRGTRNEGTADRGIVETAGGTYRLRQLVNLAHGGWGVKDAAGGIPSLLLRTRTTVTIRHFSVRRM
jgi:hypothetical protein